MRVIDAMGVSSPIVIGESFAGEEMHVLGARYSAKIRGLVYVDAAFDRGDDADNEAYSAAARPVPAAPSPRKLTWRPSRLCVRIWRNTAAPGLRRTCGPGSARILTEASLASGRRTFRSVKR